jgi:stage II sporulation protein AA (anti-sigma F factor antagonist)
MEISKSKDGDVGVLAPAGAIDTRGAMDFEREVMQMLDQGTRFFVIDLGKVELITSSGIRVLVMLTRSLKSRDGELVLCGITEQVRMIFDISGLLQHFTICATQPDAVAHLSRRQSSAPDGSKLSRLMMRILDVEGAFSRKTAATDVTGVAGEVADVLARNGRIKHGA